MKRTRALPPADPEQAAVSPPPRAEGRPRFLRYSQELADRGTYCCYKDDPCGTHRRVLGQLVGIALGRDVELEPAPPPAPRND